MAVQASVIILPTIGEALNIPTSRQQWIVSAYNLTFGCFLVCFPQIVSVSSTKRQCSSCGDGLQMYMEGASSSYGDL